MGTIHVLEVGVTRCSPCNSEKAIGFSLEKVQTGCTYNFRFAEEVSSQLNQVGV